MTIATVTAGEVVDPDWGNDVADALNSLMGTSATFTPTLTNLAVGTGGSAANTARYVFLGGPNTTDTGLLFVTGTLTLGTSGASVGSNATTRLPAGFNTAGSSQFPVGVCMFYDASATLYYPGQLWTVTSDQDDIRFITTSGVISATTSTTPFTWAAGDGIQYSYTVIGVRV